MRKYLILTFNYAGMGGAELYVRDKQEYMHSKGWTVFMFGPGKMIKPESILIEDLKKYANGLIPYLHYYPHACTKRQINKTIQWFLKAIEYQSEDEIIIESHTHKGACWGELIAKECKAKHICFILAENFHDICLEFMDFKHKRRELAGTYDDSLIKMFKNYKAVPENERYYLVATNSQVVKDIRFDQIPKRDGFDWVIASLGRLEKGYVEIMLKEVRAFAERHLEKKIMMILIASDDSPGTKEMIRSVFRNSVNVHVHVTGVLSPIPRSIFGIVDVFVSSATSAQISACEGVPTITIDGNDYKGIGILGYTTSEDLYHATLDDVYDANELIEKVLVDKLCSKIPFDSSLVWLFKQKDWMGILDSHMDFIMDSDRNQEYFDVLSSEPGQQSKIKFMLCKILGMDLYDQMRRIIHA